MTTKMRWELAPWSEPWTGPARRRSSSFRSGWDDTLQLLARETEYLDGGLVVIEIDVDEKHLTRNRQGITQGHAPAHSGVRVWFDSKHGEQRFATAEFWNWRDNVRGVAMSLEALRAVDRWGVSHGQQYVGFRPALEAGPSAPSFDSAKEAIGWLTREAADRAVELGTPADLYRRLSRVAHPEGEDGGDEALWARLQAAKVMLAKAGVI